MRARFTFWRNFALIAGLHAAAIVTLTRWSRGSATALTQNVVWLNGSAGQAEPASAKPALQPASITTSAPAATPEEDKADEDDQSAPTADSEIHLPRSTPTASASAKPAPAPKVKVNPPRPPKPKPTAKPSPKPSPKKLLVAKNANKSSSPPPKPPEIEAKHEPPNETSPTPSAPPSVSDSTRPAAADNNPASKGLGHGNGGHAGGGAGQGRFGWYGSMLHDRFYSEWVQPGNISGGSGGNSVLVKLRIEKDGRVSSFDIVRPSGNAEIDESVRAAAKRVTQVDPLPAGLGSGDHYDVKIKFELSSD